jgi:hypothetical protein
MSWRSLAARMKFMSSSAWCQGFTMKKLPSKKTLSGSVTEKQKRFTTLTLDKDICRNGPEIEKKKEKKKNLHIWEFFSLTSEVGLMNLGILTDWEGYYS